MNTSASIMRSSLTTRPPLISSLVCVLMSDVATGRCRCSPKSSAAGSAPRLHVENFAWGVEWRSFLSVSPCARFEGGARSKLFDSVRRSVRRRRH
uniref:Putative secreted protein n=1 Tax=Ixodes ricinus TaxID=34613 RepID=A0A6B0U9K2_IXORI